MPDLLDYVGTHIPQIAGVLIMAAIGAYLAEFNSRRSRLAVATEKFRNAILAELEGLYPIPINWPGSIQIEPFLRSKFPKLQSAVEEFKMCLPKRRQKKFINAWTVYYSATGVEGYQCYHHYMPFISTYNVNGKQITKDTRDTCKETFKHNVENLLLFANQI